MAKAELDTATPIATVAENRESDQSGFDRLDDLRTTTPFRAPILSYVEPSSNPAL